MQLASACGLELVRPSAPRWILGSVSVRCLVWDPASVRCPDACTWALWKRIMAPWLWTCSPLPRQGSCVPLAPLRRTEVSISCGSLAVNPPPAFSGSRSFPTTAHARLGCGVFSCFRRVSFILSEQKWSTRRGVGMSFGAQGPGADQPRWGAHAPGDARWPLEPDC